MEHPTVVLQPGLIVIVEKSAALRWEELPRATNELSTLAGNVAKRGGILRPVFHRPPSHEPKFHPPYSLPSPTNGTTQIPDLSAFFRVEVHEDEIEPLAAEIRQNPIVVSTYIEPATELPVLNDMLPLPIPPTSISPDFTGRQGYLANSPDGVNAGFAWSQHGGTGTGVQIIDIEFSWNLTHEDLIHQNVPIYGGAPRRGDVAGRNHGTAVVGVTSGGDNGFGITGICPDSTVRTVTNVGGSSGAEAIQTAAEMLNPGDILILEMHRAGPRFNFKSRSDQAGYIAVEWWPLDLAAIKYAVKRGIVVVEAAGNGGEDLDAALYDAGPKYPYSFPPTWRNPFGRSSDDSGAILVGAGAPSPGTHGRNHGPARSRLDFSNYGGLLDAQGWGQEVTTCGYGDLQGGQDENLWYTDKFAGTSSATPIVAGVLACVQGVRKANGRNACTPAEMRYLLRQNTGAQQEDGTTDPVTGAIANPASQRIGSLPNLQLLIAEALNLP